MTPTHRFRVLRVAALLSAVAQVHSVHNASAEIKVGTSRHRHGVAKGIQQRADGSATSNNWSGYAVTGSTGSVTDARGSWTVPAVTCSGSEYTYSSSWVGIDGWSSATLEQIGTESNCLYGVPAYDAWYEFLPQDSVGQIIPNFQVQPGDLMSAEVKFTAGRFSLTITDERTGASFSTREAVQNAVRSSAEWITEAPEISGAALPLADFGTVAYVYDNTGVANTCYATVGGTASRSVRFRRQAYCKSR